jgi:cytochrome oxidase Cu insertion factor (SCO1/SenC/PrrC family)
VKENSRRNQGRWKLLALFAVCVAPVIASYLTYYVIKPSTRNNYGALIDPRAFPIPAALGATTLDGKPVSLQDYKGKWLMVQVDGGECTEKCRDKLFKMRQLRLMQGKDMGRIERIWLITDNKPLDTIVIREYDGTHMLRVKPEVLAAWLPAESGTTARDHIYMIDPIGNLMLRFPKDADPNKMKKDIAKLLKASGIG